MPARTPYKHKTKQYECNAAEQAKYLSDTDGGRAVEDVSSLLRTYVLSQFWQLLATVSANVKTTSYCT